MTNSVKSKHVDEVMKYRAIFSSTKITICSSNSILIPIIITKSEWKLDFIATKSLILIENQIEI